MKKQMSVRAMLNLIDGYLTKGNTSAKELWDVLCALRGPDDNREVKLGTTTAIRARAFPKTAKKIKINLGAAFYPRTYTPKQLDDPKLSPHFCGHTRRAARALNMD